MKGKQLLILLVLVIVLGAAGYVLQRRNQATWTQSPELGGRKVLEFPINDVARILFKTTGSELNIVKKNDEWTVRERADYPANFEQVSGVLRKLWELKPVQEVKVGPSQMSRLELVEPGQGEASGTLVELKDKDGKNLAAVLLGKKFLRKSEGPMPEMSGFPAGRYVMPVGGKNKVSLVSETFEDVETKPERWLQRDFIKIENPKSITLAGQIEPMHWTLSRDTATAEWKLADAKPEEKLDSGKTSSLATLFSSPSFKDVLAPDAKPEETGLDKPSMVTIETFDNFTYTLKIGKLTNEAYPMQIAVIANLSKERSPGKDEKPEDKTRLDEEFKTTHKRLEDKLAAEKKFEQRPYLIEKFTVEPLLKERTALLVEKKPEPAATSATSPPVSATTPPITVTTPPVSATTPPISVTTPPVSAPTPVKTPARGTPVPKSKARPGTKPPATPPPPANPAPQTAAPPQKTPTPEPAPAPSAPPSTSSTPPSPPPAADSTNKVK